MQPLIGKHIDNLPLETRGRANQPYRPTCLAAEDRIPFVARNHSPVRKSRYGGRRATERALYTEAFRY